MKEKFFTTKKIITSDRSPLFIGHPEKTYHLGVSPNFSASKNADKFSMCLIEDSSKSFCVVNSYFANGSLEKHIRYFNKIVSNFNIASITIDAMGAQFLELVDKSLIQKAKVTNKFFSPEGINEVYFSLQETLFNSNVEFAIKANTEECFPSVRLAFDIISQLSFVEVRQNKFDSLSFVLSEEAKENGCSGDEYQSLLLANWGRKLFYSHKRSMNIALKEVIDKYFAEIDKQVLQIEDFYQAKNAFIDDVNLILKERGDRNGVTCVARLKNLSLKELSEI